MTASEQALTKLKVPELKAKCKELKIPNFSKLSKTDLIAKILSATSDSTANSLTHADDTHLPITTQETTKTTTATDQQAKKPKERKKSEPKRKTPDHDKDDVSTPVTKKSAKVDSREQNEGARKGGSADPQPKIAHDTILQSRNSAVPPLTQPATTAPAPDGDPHKVNLRLPASELLEQPARHTATSKVISKPKGRIASAVVRPRFKPLAVIATRPPAPLPTASVVPAQAVDLTSPTSRIHHIETHFANDLLTQLHKYRIKPIVTPPYPIPPGFPKSSSAHLAFQGLHPRLHTSSRPDEFKVALRFWIARLHSYMQLGSGEAWSAQASGMGVLSPDISAWPPVSDCKRVAGDIWAITIIQGSENVKYLVIGAIGEVIGHSRGVKGVEGGLVEGCRVRSDWAIYIADDTRRDLPNLVKSKDTHAFPGGISKAWRVKQYPQQSPQLVEIAERAVLAGCALNSFSGEKMSSIAMDAAWLGRPVYGAQATGSMETLDIYLPEMSQVVSVHLPSNLHPSLAIVHRVSGYSEYLLAETGQVVGTEDEGVVELWQGLLGCDEKGTRDGTKSSAFWKGWEARVRSGTV